MAGESSPLSEQQQRMQDAENAIERGRYEESLAVYLDLLADRLHTTATTGEAFTVLDCIVIERTAELATLFGELSAAGILLASLASLNYAAANLYGGDYCIVKQAQLELASGSLHNSEQLIRGLADRIGDIEDLPFADGDFASWENRCQWPNTDGEDRALLFAGLYLVLGSLLAAHGQYADARICFARGLALTDSASLDLTRRLGIPLRMGLAQAFLEAGDLPAVRAHLSEFATHDERISTVGWRTRLLELRGKHALLTGELGEALSGFEEVVDICRRHGFTLAGALATLNLSHVLIILNHTGRARGLLRVISDWASGVNEVAVAARAEFLGRIASSRAHSCIDNMAIAPSVKEMQTRRHVVAEPDKASGVQTELPQAANFLTFFENRALEFQVALGEGDIAAAAAGLERMQQVFQFTDSRLIQLRLVVLAAMLAYYTGAVDEAEQLFLSIREEVQDRGLQHELWQVERFLAWCSVGLNRADAKREASVDQAAKRLDRLANSLDPALRAVYLLNKWTQDEEVLAVTIDRLIDLDQRRRSANLLERVFLEWRIGRALYELTHAIDRHKSLVSQRMVPFASLRQASPSQSLFRYLLSQPLRHVTITFLVLPDRVLAIRRRFLKLDFNLSVLSRIELRELVGAWHKAMISDLTVGTGALDKPERDGAMSDSERTRLARRIAGGLGLDNLLGSLSTWIRRLRIIPDDALHGLPFAGLRLEGRLLPERFAMSFGHTTQAVVGRGRDRKAKIALLIGVERGIGPYPPLPGTRVELDTITPVMEDMGLQVQQLIDEEATREALLKQLPTARIAHIACHGEFEPDAPDRSGLILLSDRSEPRTLSLRDLGRLDLSGVAHITLSSCWAADNFILPGRWIIGLPETLNRAGVASVLGCLWQVSDVVVVKFVERFYRHAERYPRDEALRRAQLDCRQGRLDVGAEIDTKDAFFWAGFVLHGERTRLE